MSNDATSSRHSVLLIGGPDAGKTNYVFRLWLAIKSNVSFLHSERLPDNLEYLEAGASDLLRGDFAPHTPSDVHNQCVIPIRYSNASGETCGDLIVPDCSGEQWLGIYRKREWTEKWDQLIKEGCGCLLFVRVDSDQIVAPLDWISCAALYGKPLDEGAPDPESIAPTQIVLTDWIQCLRQAFTAKVRGQYRPRIGVIVGAWDLVPEDRKALGPTAYIAKEFPLLGQFMEANEESFQFAVFGLSVVGGDLKNEPAFRKSYLDGEPLSSGYIVHSLDESVVSIPDLTVPVAWALGLYQADK